MGAGHLLPAELTLANPIGLRLQVLEADHLDTARTGMACCVTRMAGRSRASSRG
jgi:hypothetical protein